MWVWTWIPHFLGTIVWLMSEILHTKNYIEVGPFWRKDTLNTKYQSLIFPSLEQCHVEKGNAANKHLAAKWLNFQTVLGNHLRCPLLTCAQAGHGEGAAGHCWTHKYSLSSYNPSWLGCGWRRVLTLHLWASPLTCLGQQVVISWEHGPSVCGFLVLCILYLIHHL